MKYLIRDTRYWMIKNFDLISIILVTCLTWLSRLDLSKSTSIILKEPLEPQPIFESNIVQDYPNGNLSGALNKFAKNDIILLYLYSHWDEESVSHKSEIEQLAEVINYKIPVVAVNCWNNKSNCHNSIKPNRFPQLYAYVSNNFLVEYKRAIEPLEIFHFVDSLFNPFHFPVDTSEFINLMKLYDATLILCLNSQYLQFSKKVRIFHEISSFYKGRGANDPNIGFIILSETDESFISLRLSLNLNVNEMLLYSAMGLKKKYTGKLTVSEVLKFVDKNAFRAIVSKYSPTGTKSLHSQELLRSGVLVLYIDNGKNQLTWDNVVTRCNFHSIALQVKKCSSEEVWSIPIDDLLRFKRGNVARKYLRNYQEKLACQQYSRNKILSNFSSDISSLISSLKSNQSKNFHDYVADPFVTLSHLMGMEWICRKHSISTDFDLDNINLETPMVEESQYLDTDTQHNCRKQFNRSIHFAELDGSKYPKLLENLGIPVDQAALPRVVVVDWKNEIVHHMESEVNHVSMNHLVSQLLINNLTAHVQSHDAILQHSLKTHFRPIDAGTLALEIKNPDYDLVVYYYTPWCSYCSSLSNLLIMLSRYFSSYPAIHFTSLNTFTNDLPWNYQSERVPSLIMYPRGRKSESVVFHIAEPSVSLSSMIKFILENSGDTSLNLNAPSINFKDNDGVSCDRECLESAGHTVVKLQKNYRTALRDIDREIEGAHSRISQTCALAMFSVFELRLSSSRNWADYYAKRFCLQYQSRLITDFIHLSNTRCLLRDKLSRLATINSGIYHVLGNVSVRRSVESTASDILQHAKLRATV